MLVVLFIFIIFFILGFLYLKNVNLNKIKRIMLTFMYFVIFLLFNIIFIKVFVLNYVNSEVINSIVLVENSNKEYGKLLDEYKNKKEDLINKLNNNDYNTIKERYNEINKTIVNLDKRMNELNDKILEYSDKLVDVKKTYEEVKDKTKFIIDDFPTYHQFPNYPNGCESVSLYLMLKFYNVDVTVEDIVEKLKKGDAPYRENGILYGGDPEVEFVGDPRLKSGYGVYEKPIIAVANYFKSGIVNITGSSLDDVLNIVKKGIPVQVWASINLKNTYICAKWQSTSTDRIIEWKCGLHSLVVIGFTYDKIITSDPYTGEVEYYSKTQFEKMYNTYGKRALYYEK